MSGFLLAAGQAGGRRGLILFVLLVVRVMKRACFLWVEVEMRTAAVLVVGVAVQFLLPSSLELFGHR